MAIDADNKTAPDLGASAPLAQGPNFIRNRVPAQTTPAPTPARFADAPGQDEYEHQVRSHRAELDALDLQITNLDRTIELEQEKVRQGKLALDNSYRTRARLLHLRSAMLNFVLELEARNTD